MKAKTLLLLAAGLAGINSVYAHDVWLEYKNGEYELVYGHVDELETLEPEKVRVIRGFSNNGKELDIQTQSGTNSMKVKSKSRPGMITINYDNGFWTKTGPTTWENQSKRNFPEYLDASHSLKFNKNLMAWHDDFKKPTGQRFEIVPLESPLKGKNKDSVKIQVLYDGEPLADAAVEVNGLDDSFKTDKRGQVRVSLNGARSLQYIAAYHRYKLPGHLDADEISLSANLVFQR